jgi:hypothetical protein
VSLSFLFGKIGDPNQTLFERTDVQKVSGKRLLDLLIEHYDELERLLELSKSSKAIKPLDKKV